MAESFLWSDRSSNIRLLDSFSASSSSAYLERDLAQAPSLPSSSSYRDYMVRSSSSSLQNVEPVNPVMYARTTSYQAQPELLRRGSSRRRVVVRRAPSIRSERNRVSMISEEPSIKRPTTNTNTNTRQYGYYVPKRKLFNFKPFRPNRRNSIKFNYHRQQDLNTAFGPATIALQKLELYNRSKREPLLLRQYELTRDQYIKPKPQLKSRIKLASIDLKNQLIFEDPASSIIDLYYNNYPETSDTETLIQAPVSTEPPIADSDLEFTSFQNSIYNAKLTSSRAIFQSNAKEEHIKRLAMTIYLRRLLSAKIALRLNLETSISSGSKHTLSTDKILKRDEDDWNFVPNHHFVSPPVLHDLYSDSSSIIPNLKFKYDSLINLSFHSSAGSKISFHSFK